MTLAYVIDDDKLWLHEDDWVKEPGPQAIRAVMRYCPDR